MQTMKASSVAGYIFLCGFATCLIPSVIISTSILRSKNNIATLSPLLEARGLIRALIIIKLNKKEKAIRRIKEITAEKIVQAIETGRQAK